MIEGQAPDIGEMVLHHTADAWTIDLYPIGARSTCRAGPTSTSGR